MRRSAVTWIWPTKSERQRKVFVQSKHNIPEQSGFVAYVSYVKILEKPGGYWWECMQEKGILSPKQKF